MRMEIVEITHSGIPSVTGYNKGCRCPECGIANSKKVSDWRDRSKDHTAKTVRSVRPEPEQTAVSETVTALDMARQDMADILRMIASDPDWCSQVEEGIPGEIAALRTLIDTHNRSGQYRRIQLDSYDGTHWVSAAETPVPESQSAVPTVAATDPVVVQLPQRAPLALPRDVRSGTSPTVPSEAHTETSSRGTPKWG
jgi:hypothetical protein